MTPPKEVGVTRQSVLRSLFAVAAVLLCAGSVHAQDDGGVGHDSRGNEVLESIYIPNLAHAPFSLTLNAEWTRPLMTGGSFVIVNQRPIKRDSEGRVYEERWLMVPKGTNIKSRMSWIQIADPVAGLYYECNPRQRVCEMHTFEALPVAKISPAQQTSGPLKNGRGYRTHEDKGADTVGGVPVHAYRDTTVLNANILGNDSPMTYVRDVRYSPELGINLTSILQAPAVGEQRFAVTEITTSEPEPHWFQPPEGYRIVDVRASDAARP